MIERQIDSHLLVHFAEVYKGQWLGLSQSEVAGRNVSHALLSPRMHRSRKLESKWSWDSDFGILMASQLVSSPVGQMVSPPQYVKAKNTNSCRDQTICRRLHK